MESNEKQVSERSVAVVPARVQAPTSIEEAYELGWRWRRESFVGLDHMRYSLGVITKREGLAHFVSETGNEGIVIPFTASYEFGTPRYPKYPYTGGSVCLVDDDEEHAATLERKAMRASDTELGTANQSEPGSQMPMESPKEAEKDREAFWVIKERFRGRVIFSYSNPNPETEAVAIGLALDVFGDQLQIEISEVKKNQKTKKERHVNKRRARS
jgi:hypothetical protein